MEVAVNIQFSVCGSVCLRHDGILEKKPNFEPWVYFHPIYLLNKVELLVFIVWITMMPTRVLKY